MSFALLERYERVVAEVKSAALSCGRAPEEITLLAVSKFHEPSDMLILSQAGQKFFGENYVQEALAKKSFLASAGSSASIHLIGHIQKRKVPQIAGEFVLIHTLDSKKLASALERRLAEMGKVQKVLVEVNIASEPQKTGLEARDLTAFADYIQTDCPHLALEGLMCMPPWSAEGEAARPYFARLRQLRDDLRTETGLALPELSMGMSGDFPWAVAEGATIVRIGTAIFGPRPVRV